jgi:FkbM family methyltransferase
MPLPDERVEFVRVAVAGSPPVEFCVDRTPGDPVARWFLDHGWIDEPVQRAFLQFVRPGARVVDLGCHLGTFSLSAAGLGAEVLALDAASEHVDLVSRAAERNGFRMRVVHGAAADDSGAGVVSFVVRSIHGHLLSPGEVADSVEVPIVVVDDLIDALGWESVDVMKMDIEGAEPAALRGMGRLFERGSRPAIVIECNAIMLGLQDSSAVELRQMLTDLGYRLYLIDHLRPGVLVETDVDTVQTESASDLLAVVEPPADLDQRWTVRPAFSREMTVARLLAAAAGPEAGYRAHSADVLAHGPWWLRESPEVTSAVRALANDVQSDVRDHVANRGARSVGLSYEHVTQPRGGGPPLGTVVSAQNISIFAPHDGLEPFDTGGTAAEEEPVLSGLSFDLMAGETVAVVSDSPWASYLLLHAMAGTIPVFGDLVLFGPALPLFDVGQVFEDQLSIEENVVVLGTLVGSPPSEVAERVDEFATRAGAPGKAHEPLGAQSADVVGRLALAVALECARAQTLLVDLPRIEDRGFLGWAQEKVTQLHGQGMALVQTVRDPDELISRAHRAMWLHAGQLWAFGHPGSVFEAQRRNRLGLALSEPGPTGRPELRR